jgi:hypothetical protein
MAIISREPKYMDKYLPQCHLVHHKSHMVYPASESVTELREVGVWHSLYDVMTI